MPHDAGAIYQRGKYWLDWDKRADGSLRSPFLAIFWYDRASRRIRSRSSRTADIDAATEALDRLYLADQSEAPAFCPTCGRPHASAALYLITDAINDYRVEHGDERDSVGSIRARLNNVIDFLEATDRLTATCAQAASLITPLRKWLAAKPVVWRDGEGNVTKTAPRTPAAVEEAIHALRAVLNHAHAQKRIESPPSFKGKSRQQVSAPVTTRIGVAELAMMLRYAADPAHPRRDPLHGFLVASICTLARPDAVFDLSTKPERQQWQPGSPAVKLNPAGRVQTKKHRPIVPCPPVLSAYLASVAADKKAKGWVCQVGGERIGSVKTAWNAMLKSLGLPMTREMKPYVVRRSMATLLREHGASAWDVEGQLGHRTAGTSEIYAISTLFPTAYKALGDVLGQLEHAAPGAMHRRRTGDGAEVVALTPRKSADGVRG